MPTIKELFKLSAQVPAEDAGKQEAVRQLLRQKAELEASQQPAAPETGASDDVTNGDLQELVHTAERSQMGDPRQRLHRILQGNKPAAE